MLGIALALILLSVLTMPWWTVDDAFISYRYGKNLLLAGRLTWNLGDPTLVEGYTGVLLPLLAAGILKLGLPLIDSIKVLGLLAAFGTVAWLHRGLHGMGVPRSVRWVACLLLAANPLLTMHALSGLETGFFAFFVVGALVLALDQGGARLRARSALLGLMLILAGLCRPEGIALAVMMAAGSVWVRLRENTGARNSSRLVAAMLALAVLGAYWLWRWWYYGAFFPNSYHAKVYDGIVNLDSAWAMAKFLGYYIAAPLAAIAVIFIAWKGDKSARVSGSNPILIVSALFIGIVFLTYLHSNLWMNYGSRFFFPFLPVLLLLMASRMPWDKLKAIAGWGKVLLMGLGVIQVAILGFRQYQEREFLRYYDRIVKEELIPAGEALRAELPHGKRVASYMDAGAIGFYSEAEIIDFGRLSDPYLAQNKPNTQEVVAYFYAQNPDAVVITSWQEDEIDYTDEAMAIVRDPRFEAYHFKRSWGNSVGYPYWQRLYIRD